MTLPISIFIYLAVMSCISFNLILVMILLFHINTERKNKIDTRILKLSQNLIHSVKIECIRTFFFVSPIFAYSIFSFIGITSTTQALIVSALLVFAVLLSIPLPFRYINITKAYIISFIESIKEEENKRILDSLNSEDKT